ncbi:hypothetical protein Leryth_015808 [Lithospermum erythrorhizon]|nr:hypothetical protein Leryth_015808 [Lithospermum erythrorhizon]
MAEEAVPQQMNYIDEVVLKKRRNNDQWAITRRQRLEQKIQKKKSGFVIKKPEQFIREFRDKELDLVRMKNRVKRKRKTSLLPESKLIFVIRIGGKNDMSPTSRKLLYSLRLRKLYTGVFVKANERIMDILQKLEPFVTYGYPNLKTVKDLIYKKGVIKLDKQITPLIDNNVVEQALGQYHIICIEDIVNEIANVGSHFKDVTKSLCPFTLNKAEKALQGKKKRYTDGGDAGNREDHINELISKMN